MLLWYKVAVTPMAVLVWVTSFTCSCNSNSSNNKQFTLFELMNCELEFMIAKDTHTHFLILQIVEGLPIDQQRVLLFFWTSVKYLPADGFRGLSSKLYIYRTVDSQDRLPTSHTCFYRLCLPPYPSLSIMRDRLHVITQEHVSCSFGFL